MKTLYLIRHAKSDWNDPSLSDFERPLKKRGMKNAPFMAGILSEAGVRPDLILSSPAIRAKTTAIAFANALSYPENAIVYKRPLYMSDTETILMIIREVSEKVDTLLLFGHNPGLTECANLITGGYIDNIPTCGVVEMHLKEDDWKSIGENSAEMIGFDFPKRDR